MRLALLILIFAQSVSAQIFPADIKDRSVKDNLDFLWQQILKINANGSVTGSYILKTAAFGGDVSGTYDNLLVTDNSHAHDLTTVNLSTMAAGSAVDVASLQGFVNAYISTATAWYITPYGAALSTAVYNTNSYSDPSWITSLGIAKISLSTVTTRFQALDTSTAAIITSTGPIFYVAKDTGTLWGWFNGVAYSTGLPITSTAAIVASTAPIFYIAKDTGTLWNSMSTTTARVESIATSTGTMWVALTTAAYLVSTQTWSAPQTINSSVTANTFYGDGSQLIGVITSSSAYPITSTAVIVNFLSTSTTRIEAIAVSTGQIILSTGPIYYIAKDTGTLWDRGYGVAYSSSLPITSTAVIMGLLNGIAYSTGVIPSTATGFYGFGVDYSSRVMLSQQEIITYSYPVFAEQPSGIRPLFGSSNLRYDPLTGLMHSTKLTTTGTIYTSSSINAGYYEINGSTVLSMNNKSLYIGTSAGKSITDGINNTYIGWSAGGATTGGDYNMFLGATAGQYNTTGSDNMFLGYAAGQYSTTGDDNSAIGYSALSYSKSGSANMAIGSYSAGYGTGDTNNVISSNTVIGFKSGYNLSGNDNTLIGWQSGYNITSGTGNIVIGYNQDTSGATASNELNIGGIIKGNLNPGGGITVSTLTVTGSDFSVGGSTFIVAGNYVAIGTTGPWTTATSGKTFFVIRGSSGSYANSNPIIELQTPEIPTTGRNVGVIAWENINDTSGVINSNQRIAQISGAFDGMSAGAMGGRLNFFTNLGGGNISTRMVITSTGNVGIGSTAPPQKLTVSSGTIQIDGNGLAPTQGYALCLMAGGAMGHCTDMTTATGACTCTSP